MKEWKIWTRNGRFDLCGVSASTPNTLHSITCTAPTAESVQLGEGKKEGRKEVDVVEKNNHFDSEKAR